MMVQRSRSICKTNVNWDLFLKIYHSSSFTVPFIYWELQSSNKQRNKKLFHKDIHWTWKKVLYEISWHIIHSLDKVFVAFSIPLSVASVVKQFLQKQKNMKALCLQIFFNINKNEFCMKFCVFSSSLSFKFFLLDAEVKTQMDTLGFHLHRKHFLLKYWIPSFWGCSSQMIQYPINCKLLLR